jgi:carboxymethylenebutenolidase
MILPSRFATAALSLLCAAAAACGPARPAASPAAPDPAPASAPQPVRAATAPAPLPAGAAEAQARIAASPRHAEWVMVRTGPQDSVRAWVVYPQRSERAPVVLVVHEIFGVSHWIRAVADQLAADGFIAITPDLLTMRNIPAGADGAPDPETARTEIRTLQPDDIHRQLRAVAEYGMGLPAALPRYGIVGFCWGGTVAFQHAAESPALGASVAYYGTSPAAGVLQRVRAPVLGLYGEDDARVNTTIPAAEQALRARGHNFEHHIFPGAGHGFLRAQDGQDGANLRATVEAWPRTVQWLRTHLGTVARP